MLVVGDKKLTIKDIKGVVLDGQQVSISSKGLKKVQQNHRFLTTFSKGKLIYGINTGFGPMAQYKVADRHLKELQINLIRSHSSGTGKDLSDHQVRAMMLVRLSSLMLGFSGVSDKLVFLIRDFINLEIYPCIPEHGGVGASGDLVQLAHLSQALIGEGQVRYRNKVQKTNTVLKKLGLKPLSIDIREGLAIMNGTSSMTGIGALNVFHAEQLLNWAVIFSTAINEIVGAFNDHFSEGLNEVKLHAGQRDVALTMRKITLDSKLIKNRHAVFYSAGDAIKKDFFKEKVQEYYSLRCVPQILGPILDTIRYANNIVSNEINSVNDNPVIDHNRQDVLHGGNFHGDYVSLEMDKLRIVITKLAMLCERQLNYLLNDRLNQKLPPFLNLGTLGLNYGMQGMQFTATSTVAECQTLSMSAYVHSIPNNNDNQDIVSMGTNSALLTSKVIDNAFEVLAIHAIAVIQAVDGSNCKKGLSTFSSKTYSDLRKICPKFVHDEAKSETIAKMKRFLMSNHPNLIQS